MNRIGDANGLFFALKLPIGVLLLKATALHLPQINGIIMNNRNNSTWKRLLQRKSPYNGPCIMQACNDCIYIHDACITTASKYHALFLSFSA